MLMEVFTLPYKVTILRLFEERVMIEVKAYDLLHHDASYILQRIELVGKAKQWQMDSVNIEYFGSLLDNLEFNSENEFSAESREKADRKFLEDIRAITARQIRIAL